MDNKKDPTRAIIDRPKEDQPAPPQRTNHLLVIGIDQYKDTGIANLSNAVNDAKRFKHILHSQFQFESKNITELYDESATKDRILEAFDHLLLQLTPKDNLILYFSGHGEFVDYIKRGYWVPTDARLQKRGSYISNNEVVDFFKSLKAHHIFSIIDSCFSGALFRKIEQKQLNQRVDAIPSRWLLTSGMLELVADGWGEHSPFAKTLFTFLEEEGLTEIRAMDLCNKVIAAIDYNTKEQTPRGESLHGVGHMGGQFVFYKKGYVPKAVSNEKGEQEEPALTKGLGTKKEQSNENKRDIAPPIPPTFESLKPHLKSLIESDLELALTTFKSILAKDNTRGINDITLQLGSYNRTKKDDSLGLSSVSQRDRTFARIRYALTQMIDDLEEQNVTLPTGETPKMEYHNSKGEQILLDLGDLEKSGLKEQATLLIKKLNHLKKARIVEADAARQFQYDLQIEEMEKQLKTIKDGI